MATVKIIYNGPVVDEIRQGMSIPNTFNPGGSYVDSPAFVDGYDASGVGDEVGYGKSIYATNVAGWGHLQGLLPMASTPTRFAWFEQAVYAKMEADAKSSENEGVKFDIGDDYMEELYWKQIGPNVVDMGFEVTVSPAE